MRLVVYFGTGLAVWAQIIAPLHSVRAIAIFTPSLAMGRRCIQCVQSFILSPN